MSVKEKHASEVAQTEAKNARMRAEDALQEKKALKEKLERKIAILEEKVCIPLTEQ